MQQSARPPRRWTTTLRTSAFNTRGSLSTRVRPSKSFCLKTADLDSAQAGFELNEDNMTIYYDGSSRHTRMDEEKTSPARACH